MQDFIRAGMETQPAFLVVIGIFIAFIPFLLWPGKHLSEQSTADSPEGRRGKLLPRQTEVYGEREDQRIALAASSSMVRCSPAGNTRPTSAERAVVRLITEAHSFMLEGNWSAANRLTRKALADACARLSGDHWLLAVALNSRGLYLMEQGFYADAILHLGPAVAISSEWPGNNRGDRNIAQMQANLELCKERL